jgi:ATP-dependent Clp protease ATP-binding subunit ClpB
VVLFDEIEKAHHDVFNIFLQILDEGRLTDNKGRTVDFKNAVIIMTSNLGSQYIREMAGEPKDKVRGLVMEQLNQHFRPEFLNRIDEIIVFNNLTKENIKRIIDIQLDRLADRLKEKNISITLDENAKDHLAETSFDPVYGARPLKRALQTAILNPLAMRLLDGSIQEGAHITVRYDKDNIVFDETE